MAVFPTSAISADNTSVKVKERYASAALNRKLTGYPVGVFRGYTPVVTGPDELTLQVDSSRGDSVAAAEDTGGYLLNVREDSNVVLNFTGHTQYPVYVVLEVTYSPPAPLGTGVTSATLKTVAPSALDLAFVRGTVTGGPFLQGEELFGLTSNATGRITQISGSTFYVAVRGDFTPGETIQGLTSGATAPLTSITDPNVFPKQVKLCLVSKPGATITVASDVPLDRQEPYAFRGVTAGFMPGGSIEDLQLAVGIVSEVQTARTGFNQTFADLDARLDAELAGAGSDGMASRLGLIAKTQEGSLYDGTTPGWTGSGLVANVSRDFLLKSPSFSPTTKGVVVYDPSGPTGDNVNNLCWVFDQNYNRLTDTFGRKVYGKLNYTTFNLVGTLTFTNGSTAVSGGGTTQFVTDGVEPGDIIQSPNGNFFAVATVLGEDDLTLQTSYSSVNPSDNVVTPPLRRYEINFQFYNSGDTAFSLPVTTQFRFTYQQRFDAADRPFAEGSFHPALRGRDAGATITNDGTTAADRTVLGSADARVGAVKVNGGAFRQNLALIAGANMTVAVLDTGTEYQITFTAAGGGGGGPSPAVAVSPADGAAGSIGTSLLYARQDHQHPASSAYAPSSGTGSPGVNVTSATHNSTSNFAVPTGARPRFMLLLGSFGTLVCVGAAIGTTAASGTAGIIFNANGGGAGASFTSGNLLNGFGETWDVTQFDAAQILIAHSGGGLTLQARALVLTDNL